MSGIGREIDMNDAALELAVICIGKKLCRILLKLFQEEAILGDFGKRLTVGGTGHTQADRERSAVAGQVDNPDVLAEILPPNWAPTPSCWVS
jgi:hypothetical protein